MQRLAPVALSLLLIAGSTGAVVPGGSGPRADCYSEFDGIEETNRGALPPRVECSDGDPTCDADGVCGNGFCGFRIRLCPNQHDPKIPICRVPHGGLTSLKVLPKTFSDLAAGLDLTRSACGAFVLVPVGVRRAQHAPDKPGRLHLRVTARANARPSTDKDLVVLVCNPRSSTDPCSASTTTTSTRPLTTTTTSSTSTSVSSTSTTATSVTTTTTSTTTLPAGVGRCTSSGASCNDRADCPIQPTPDNPLQGEGCCGDGVPDGAAFGEVCDLGQAGNCPGLPCASGCTAQCRGVGVCTGTKTQCIGNADCGQLETCCGDRVVDAGETCDDGNVLDGDGCPSSCHVASCTPAVPSVATSVTYTAPAGITIAGLVVFVDYPEGMVTRPKITPGFGVSIVSNDLGYGFTVAPIKLSGLPQPFMRATYDSCVAAPAATAGDFKCRVTDASDADGNVVPADQVTCAVTVQ